MKIQLDIPEETNMKLKIIKVKNRFNSINLLAVKILKDACDMIDETDEMINETWDKIKSKAKKK